eukprot:524232-Rhodomonas_salina.1
MSLSTSAQRNAPRMSNWYSIMLDCVARMMRSRMIKNREVSPGAEQCLALDEFSVGSELELVLEHGWKLCDSR